MNFRNLLEPEQKRKVGKDVHKTEKNWELLRDVLSNNKFLNEDPKQESTKPT